VEDEIEDVGCLGIGRVVQLDARAAVHAVDVRDEAVHLGLGSACGAKLELRDTRTAAALDIEEDFLHL
jgi:hypothetical protein